MKTTKIIGLVGLMTVVGNAAVTVNVKNFSSGSVGVPVLGLDAMPISGSSRSIVTGYLGTGFVDYNFAGATATSIKADFTQFVLSTTFSANPGLFSATQTTTLPGGDTQFTGKTIYTLVGNAANWNDITALVVYKSGATFPVVNGTGAGSTNTNNTTLASTVVYGTLVDLSPAQQPSGTTTYTQGVQMLVPEPSAALLGALGVLGLLRRRRI